MKYLISLFLMILISLVQTNADDHSCLLDEINIECIANNFDYYYEQKYEELWNYLNRESQLLTIEGKSEMIKGFFPILLIGRYNAELTEYQSETIEKVAIKHKKNLLLALSGSSKQIKKVVINYLQNPVFTEKKQFVELIAEIQKIQ